MKVFIQSDLHYDFFKNDLGYDHQTYFEKFFLPADVLVVAGDFANGLKISLEIIKYLAQKYKQVILTFGNHDICITPSIEPDFTFSSIYEKISFAKGEISKIKKFKKVFLLSSAKTKSEIPLYYRVLGKLNLLKIIPVSFLKSVNFLTYLVFGAKTNSEKNLLNKINS